MRPSRRGWVVPRWHGCTHWKGVQVVDVSRSLSDAFSPKESQEADVALTDGGTAGGGLEGFEVARRLPDPVPAKESQEADDTFKV